jgi:hypothetical protein
LCTTQLFRAEAVAPRFISLFDVPRLRGDGIVELQRIGLLPVLKTGG